MSSWSLVRVELFGLGDSGCFSLAGLFISFPLAEVELVFVQNVFPAGSRIASFRPLVIVQSVVIPKKL